MVLNLNLSLSGVPPNHVCMHDGLGLILDCELCHSWSLVLTHFCALVSSPAFTRFYLGSAKSAFDTEPQFAEAPKAAQRDEWMTLPPTQDDLAARMDPTKMRARKFNTGKGAGSTGGMSSAWTETPEQKLKRLQDEALGIAAPTNAAPTTSESRRSKEEERRARKMREKIDASRGKSLVEQHQEKGVSDII